jgi:hypothetical protein
MKFKSVISAIFFGLIVACGLAVVLYFSIQPKTLPKIKPSGFRDEAEVAQSIHQRLQQEIQKTRIFFVGLSDTEKNQGKVLFEFIKQLKLVHPEIKRVLFDAEIYRQLLVQMPEWQNIDSEIKVFHLPQQIQDFLVSFEATQKEQGGALLVLPTLQVTRRFEESVISAMYSGVNSKNSPPVMSVLFANYFVSTDQKTDLIGTTIPCHTSEKDQAGTGDLGCLIMRLSRVNERKLLKYKKLSGFMDQISESEYLMVLKNSQ